MSIDYRIEDFTESHYRQLLRLAKLHWRFAPFSQAEDEGRLCLWRHDVDFSPQRALRLGQIEAEEGVSTTYFVLLHSEFYNALEPKIIEIFRALLDLGHEIGLHFDPNLYGSQISDSNALVKAIAFEGMVLNEYFGRQARAVSFHNPTVGSVPIPDDDRIGEMVNAYGRSLKERFSYVSDSNGYWRFRRLRDVLETATDDSLQVLTHPEWWTPEPMAPRTRVSRCIDGRAQRQHAFYDEALARFGRENVR